MKKEFAKSNELVYKLADRVKWLEKATSITPVMTGKGDFAKKI